ncbi:MAG: Helix-turn-helix domain protein [Firmicutes bacterium ADurb.Bin262]|nr:MAG: Helix-turn-helix domain protein [Firmicutes bacterium ADurb.Bin262]
MSHHLPIMRKPLDEHLFVLYNEIVDRNKNGGDTIKRDTGYPEAVTYPTEEEMRAAQKACCGRMCAECETPAEYAWRRRSVDLGELLLDAVKTRLSEAERQAVVGHYFDKRTLTDIALGGGKSPAAVGKALQRGLGKLRDALDYTVRYQHNLDSPALAPLAVGKALAVAAAARASPKNFGERVAALREAGNITRAKLAEAAGIDIKRLEALEEGRAGADAGELVRLSAFFMTTADYLLKGEAHGAYDAR